MIFIVIRRIKIKLHSNQSKLHPALQRKDHNNQYVGNIIEFIKRKSIHSLKEVSYLSTEISTLKLLNHIIPFQVTLQF